MTNANDNHPSADDLLLLAYDELVPARASEVEAHVALCATCRTQLAELERARVATDWALRRPRRRVIGWTAAALAAAAALIAVIISTRGPNVQRPAAWPGQLEWSATAGYIAGGRPMIVIDSQLTRLEQERPYARP